jgi:hypothetical protein
MLVLEPVDYGSSSDLLVVESGFRAQGLLMVLSQT